MSAIPFQRRHSLSAVGEYCDVCGSSKSVRRLDTKIGPYFKCSHCIRAESDLDAANHALRVSFTADEGPTLA